MRNAGLGRLWGSTGPTRTLDPRRRLGRQPLTPPGRIEFLLDQQMSRSGELAAGIRELMAGRSLPGTACTARDTDHRLKTNPGIVASADGNVIDAATIVVDLPAEIARMRGISPLHI